MKKIIAKIKKGPSVFVRKTFNKSALGFLGLIFVLMTVGLFLAAGSVHAQSVKVIDFTPQVPIPGLPSGATPVGSEVNGRMTSDLLARYVRAFYDYGRAIAGILAAVVMMGGGVLWLTSAGNETRVSQAKNMITSSLIGLVLIFSSWIILNTVNPELLELRSISMTGIKPVTVVDTGKYGCCLCEGSLNVNTKLQYCISEKELTAEQCEEKCDTKKAEVKANIYREKPNDIHLIFLRSTHKWGHACGTGELVESCVPSVAGGGGGGGGAGGW